MKRHFYRLMMLVSIQLSLAETASATETSVEVTGGYIQNANAFIDQQQDQKISLSGTNLRASGSRHIGQFNWGLGYDKYWLKNNYENDGKERLYIAGIDGHGAAQVLGWLEFSLNVGLYQARLQASTDSSRTLHYDLGIGARVGVAFRPASLVAPLVRYEYGRTRLFSGREEDDAQTRVKEVELHFHNVIIGVSFSH